MNDQPTTQQLLMRRDALDVSDQDRFVSSRSRWEDREWRLDGVEAGTHRRGHCVYWPEDINANVIEIFKKLVWSMLAAPVGRKAYSPATFVPYSTAFAILGRFMTKFDYPDFVEFDNKAVKFLVQRLQEQVQHLTSDQYDDFDDGEQQEAATEGGDDAAEFCEPAFGDWEEAPEETTLAAYAEGELRFSSILLAFTAIATVHRQRRVLRRMGVAVADEDPLGGEKPRAWAERVRPQLEGGRPAIPDEIAMPLMTAVDRLLGKPADDVIRLQQRLLAARAELVKRLTLNYAMLRSSESLHGFGFSTLPGETEPWHPTLPIVVNGLVQGPRHTARILVMAIADACYLCLLQLTGMRLGEIIALRSGPEKPDGLPACVERVPSASRERDLFYAVAAVKKGNEAPEPERWLIGSVPAKSTAIPLPVRAIQIVERLFAPWRSFSSDPKAANALFLILMDAGLPIDPARVRSLTVGHASLRLKWGYSRLLDWGSLPDFARNGQNMVRYKRLEGYNISASQWRKTFAVHVARTDSRLLNALRRHFKHMRLSTTEGAYIGADAGLLEDFDEAQLQMSTRFLRERTQGRSATFGGTGTIIQRNMRRIRLIDEQGDPKLGKDLPAVLQAVDMKFFFADHGMCAISIAPDKARCHDLAGNPTFLNDRPDYTRQAPDVCCACRCFVADASHIPFWRQRFLDSNKAKRELTRQGEQGTAWVFEVKARRALTVLRKLSRGSREE